METAVILHNIRSSYNVGSIFRTADGAGVSRIYLAGYTPAPVDRFGRSRADIAKVALGAEKSVSWEKVGDTARLIVQLQEDGFEVIAVEQSKNSVPLKNFERKQKTAFIFGPEVEGLSEEILNMCDKVVEVPMRGSKKSLNVSVAAGIVLFQNS